MSSGNGKMCTLVFSRTDSEYPREVLGHGGVNTFPDYEGTCKGCGLFIRAANPDLGLPIPCPSCGTGVTLQPGTSFGDWRYQNLDHGSCDFIEQAARAANRIPVQPLLPTS